jgi:hypothetical protein
MPDTISQWLKCLIGELQKHPLDVLTLCVAIATFLAALYIPRKIMLNQLYTDLVSQYQNPEMGFAILSIFDFYANDCKNNRTLINEKYIERYKKEIGDPVHIKKDIEKTLHFQRRTVAYFFWDLAKLYFDYKFPRLSKKQLSQMLESNERNLISLILQMSEANKECFAKTGDIAEPPDEDESPMNKLIKRLYDATEEQT